MNKNIKMITFDLDDTLWDNYPVITKAEIDTRKWIEDRVGKVHWGDLNNFLKLREDLIKKNPCIAWDISMLRKEIFREKLSHIKSKKLKDKIVNGAFEIFISKRHEIKLFDGVESSLKKLSKKYILGALTNGNADIYRLEIGKHFKFSISSLEAKNSKPNRAHFDMAVKNYTNISFDNVLHIGDHQINDIFAAYNLGIDTLWFNNKNAEWSQKFKKPDEFCKWENLTMLVEKKYGK